MRVSQKIVDALSRRWPCLHIEGFDDEEAVKIVEEELEELKGLLILADSELSAIAHGRPPSDKAENENLAWSIRAQYETRTKG